MGTLHIDVYSTALIAWKQGTFARHWRGNIPLSLRRSTINVENVVVRLWQSRYNMAAGGTPAVLFYCSRWQWGVSAVSWALLPPRRHSRHPSNGGELSTYHCGAKFPSAEGWRALRDGVVIVMAGENKNPAMWRGKLFCRRNHNWFCSFVWLGLGFQRPAIAYNFHDMCE